MWRIVLKMAVVLLALVCLLAAAGWYLVHDEAFLKARISKVVTRASGRALVIQGPLRVNVRAITTLEVQRVRLANPGWALAPDLFEADRLVASIDLAGFIRGLFQGPLVVVALSMEDCRLDLIENDQGQRNWNFLPQHENALAEHRVVELKQLRIRRCAVSHAAPNRSQALNVELTHLDFSETESSHYSGRVEGLVNGQKLSLDGRFGPLRAFTDGGAFAHAFEMYWGENTLRSSGSLTDAVSGRGARIELLFNGPEISTVIADLALPGISTGPFDFSVRLDSNGDMTDIAIDGDLGSLDIEAEGSVTQLSRPDTGRLNLEIAGPDLHALGQLLGIEGLVEGAFTAQARTRFEPGRVRFESAVLATAQERIEVSGSVAGLERLAGAELQIRVHSDEAGRWLPLVAKPGRPLGPLDAMLQVRGNQAGHLSIDSTWHQPDMDLAARGQIGAWPGLAGLDLILTFSSRNLQSLGRWLDRKVDLPAVAMSLSGRIKTAGALLRLHAVKLSLSEPSGTQGAQPKAEHHATISGLLDPQQPLAGSALTLDIDSPGMASLVALLATPGTGRVALPDYPLQLQGSVMTRSDVILLRLRHLLLGSSEFSAAVDWPRAEGFAGSRFAWSGHGPELETLWPGMDLHGLKGPFELSGTWTRSAGLDLIDALRLQTPQLRLTGSGQIDNRSEPKQFELELQAESLDATFVQQKIGQWVGMEPVSVRAQVNGTPQQVRLHGLRLQQGENILAGHVQLELADRRHLSGSLESDRIDLSGWMAARRAAAGSAPDEGSGAEAAATDRMFGDEPVITLARLPLDLDLQIGVAEAIQGGATLHNVVLGVYSRDTVLRLDPFEYQEAGGGQVFGAFLLDGRGAVPGLTLRAQAKGARLGWLAAEERTQATLPPIDLELSVSGLGRTWHDVAASVDGTLRAYYGAGEITSWGHGLFLSDFTQTLFARLNVSSKDNASSQLECAVFGATAVKGVVTVAPLVVQTRETRIFSDGVIDLASEQLDLTFNSRARTGMGISAGSLVNPFVKVGGTLTQPRMELDATNAVLHGGAAVATAGLSLLGKLVADRFMNSKDACGDARKKLLEADKETSNRRMSRNLFTPA